MENWNEEIPEIIKEPSEHQTLIFTYGTLKRGFINYHFIENLIHSNDAVYCGSYATIDLFPLVIGPYGIPYLLNLPGSCCHRIPGELYSVSRKGLEILDDMEGVSFGHYERLPIRLVRRESSEAVVETVVESVAYFAHRSYAEAMWEKNKKEGLSDYTADMVEDFVKRGDRPRHRSFMDEILEFCSSS